MRTLMSVDDMVDAVLTELAASGELDNTLVIFTSDNGNHWGEFRFVKKWLPYTASIEVPLFMRWPGHFGAGVEDDRMVVNVDVGTTILDAVGIIPDPVRRSTADRCWNRGPEAGYSPSTGGMNTTLRRHRRPGHRSAPRPISTSRTTSTMGQSSASTTTWWRTPGSWSTCLRTATPATIRTWPPCRPNSPRIGRALVVPARNG